MQILKPSSYVLEQCKLSVVRKYFVLMLPNFLSNRAFIIADSNKRRAGIDSRWCRTGAVAFEAAKAYEDHCARNGKPQSHALAKELFAGFAGAAVDRLVETKGADAWSAHQRQRAQAHAQEQIQETFTEEVYEQNY
jgi:hypothetical protein